MAFIQKVNIPPNAVNSFSLKDFSGGLNNRSDEVADNQLTDVLNMMFSDETLLETRQGQRYYSAFEYDGAIVYMDEYRPYVGNPQMVVATPTTVYFDDVAVKTVTGKITGITHEGLYYFADGDKLYCYGKFPSVDTTYVDIIGTPVDTYVVMEIVSPGTYTPLDNTHQQGVTAYDYTDYKIYYMPCTNELNDTYKGANVVPSGVKFIISHKGRLFVSGQDNDDDNVFIGDIRSNFYFPVYLPIQVPPDSDKIKGLIVYDDDVVVGRGRDLYSISGDTNRTDAGVEVFTLRKINTHTGLAGLDTMDVAHNYLFYFGADGSAYALDATRGEYKVVRSTILSKFIDVFKTPIGWTIEDLQNAHSIYHNDFWYVSNAGKTLVYSYRRQSWLLFDNMNVTCFYVKDNQLIWGNSIGRISEFYDGYMDYGLPYLSFFYTKNFNMGDANSFKQYKEIFLVARTYNDYNSDIRIRTEIDYADVKESVTIDNKISIWGEAVFGDRFINRNINDTYPIIIGRRGRNIRFKISNRFYTHGQVDYIADLEYYIGRIEGVVVYVLEDSSYYRYTDRQWEKLTQADIEQKMKIYQINGIYEMRGRR